VNGEPKSCDAALLRDPNLPSINANVYHIYCITKNNFAIASLIPIKLSYIWTVTVFPCYNSCYFVKNLDTMNLRFESSHCETAPVTCDDAIGYILMPNLSLRSLSFLSPTYHNISSINGFYSPLLPYHPLYLKGTDKASLKKILANLQQKIVFLLYMHFNSKSRNSRSFPGIRTFLFGIWS
jgi:hypothetical protein